MPAQTKPGDACAPPGVRIRVSLPLLSVRIARADLHGSARVADHVAPAIIDRPRCPVAARPVDRLAVALIDHIAGRPRRYDGAGDDRTANDAADDSAGAPTALRAGVGCRRGERAGDQEFNCPAGTLPEGQFGSIPHHTYTTSTTILSEFW